MGRMKNGKVGFSKKSKAEKTEPIVGTDDSKVTEIVETSTMAENEKANGQNEENVIVSNTEVTEEEGKKKRELKTYSTEQALTTNDPPGYDYPGSEKPHRKLRSGAFASEWLYLEWLCERYYPAWKESMLKEIEQENLEERNLYEKLATLPAEEREKHFSRIKTQAKTETSLEKGFGELASMVKSGIISEQDAIGVIVSSTKFSPTLAAGMLAELLAQV